MNFMCIPFFPGCLQAEYATTVNDERPTAQPSSGFIQESTAASMAVGTAKKQCTSLFGHYKKAAVSPNHANDSFQRREKHLSQYLEAINSVYSDSFPFPVNDCVFKSGRYTALNSLFERVFCVPASSAPVESLFP